jgi:hypothetical protein
LTPGNDSQNEIERYNSQQIEDYQQINFFTAQNRLMFVIAMLEQAILLEHFDVACEFMNVYKLDILKFKTLKAVDYLIKQMDGHPYKYEAKVYLATLLMPCMSRA